DPSTPAIYTLSLHDALPISPPNTSSRNCPLKNMKATIGPSCGHSTTVIATPTASDGPNGSACVRRMIRLPTANTSPGSTATKNRSEEHTSELQSRRDLVCRL